MLSTSQSPIVRGTFKNHKQLSDWLGQNGVDLALWGVGKAKSVADLFLQVEGKERTLEVIDGVVHTALSVMKLVIRQPGKPKSHLVSNAQKLPGKAQEKRNTLPNIKLSDGEAPRHACIRGVLEELGSVVPDESKIAPITSSLVTWSEFNISSSFPAISSHYKYRSRCWIVAFFTAACGRRYPPLSAQPLELQKITLPLLTPPHPTPPQLKPHGLRLPVCVGCAR